MKQELAKRREKSKQLSAISRRLAEQSQDILEHSRKLRSQMFQTQCELYKTFGDKKTLNT